MIYTIATNNGTVKVEAGDLGEAIQALIDHEFLEENESFKVLDTQEA